MTDLSSFLDNILSEFDLSANVISTIKTHLTKEIGVKDVEDLYDVHSKDLPKKVSGLPAKKKPLIIKTFQEKVSPKKGETFDRNVDSSLLAFIKCCGLSDEKATSLFDYFITELEIKIVDDLSQLEEYEGSIYDAVSEEEIEVSVVEMNRFFRLQRMISHAPQMLPSSEANQLHDNEAKLITDHMIHVRYIDCKCIFERDCGAKTVEVNPDVYTMKELRIHIVKAEEYDLRHDTIELYSKEGYPFNTNNVCTSKKTLTDWKIEDNDLLYVFPRRIEQPNQSISNKSLPPIDHEIGSDELTILTQFDGTFKIHVNLMVDSPEDFYRKISNATGLPTTKMSLYVWNYETEEYRPLTIQSNVSCEEKILLVLNDHSQYRVTRSAEYGKKSYNMMHPQTDKGVSKFFSILRFMFLKHKMTVDVSKLLDYLAEKTKCPPLIYALRVLYENSYLTLPLWVALVEGCFQLFKAWLNTFCRGSKYNVTEVFEFSDYFWSAIMNECKGRPDTSLDVTVERVSLVCPISQIKIFEAVGIPGSTLTYDKLSVLKAMKDGKKIEGLSDGILLDESQIFRQTNFDQLLIANPWGSDREVYVWKTNISPSLGRNALIPCPELPCEWYQLASCLENLCILPPDRLFGMESLTFHDTEGHLVLYMGFTKDVGDKHKLYNPITHEYLQKKRKNLKDVAKHCEEKNVVSKDLTAYVSDEKLDEISGKDLLENAKPMPITTEVFKWEPEEAIMVLLDTSGSMTNPFSNRLEEKNLKRCDAATAFFAAFSSRTQAYNLRHSIGLIQFAYEPTIHLQLNWISQDFEEKLQLCEVGGGTSLNTAMMRAGELLNDYAKDQKSLRYLRILCLTDGDNTDRIRNIDVVNFLKENNIIVDTIMISGSRNVAQKAITHATGGVCLRPNSLIDGLKIFEMEPFLSLQARKPNNYRIALIMTDSLFQIFTNTSRYPFDEKLECTYTLSNHVKTVSPLKVTGLKPEDGKCSQRVMTELRDIVLQPLPNFEIFPSEERITLWMVLLKGPDYSPYFQGVFRLRVEFPPAYPNLPPNIRFCTPIYHCNINSTGRICHKVLAESYSPSLSMKDILGCIFSLLLCPDPDDALDSVIGHQLAAAHSSKKPFDQTEFWKTAKEHTSKHADKKENYAELKKEFNG